MGLALRTHLMEQVENELRQDSQVERYRILGKRIHALLKVSGEMLEYTIGESCCAWLGELSSRS